MSQFSQKIKLLVFKLLAKPYKKRLYRNSYNHTEFKLLSDLLRQKKLHFIDVGANKGEFIYIAEKCLPADKIWAFEPLPYFAEKLQALFAGIQVFNFALSDKNSNTTLYLPVKNGIPDDSLSSVNKPQNGDFETFEVQLKTLDSITAQYGLNQASFLKIDVEGHEFSVLEGGKNFIKQHVEIMLVEIEERHHPGKSLQEMISGIENDHFVCYYLHPKKQQLVRFSENPAIFQKKEELNTPLYINNFWFFAKQIQPQNVVDSLNQNTF